MFLFKLLSDSAHLFCEIPGIDSDRLSQNIAAASELQFPKPTTDDGDSVPSRCLIFLGTKTTTQHGFGSETGEKFAAYGGAGREMRLQPGPRGKPEDRIAAPGRRNCLEALRSLSQLFKVRIRDRINLARLRDRRDPNHSLGLRYAQRSKQEGI